MSTITRPISESAEHDRVRVLREYGILDTSAEAVFDDLTTLAAKICGTPISLISLIDRDRQWFKSHHGIAASETPLSVSFCWHTIKGTQPMVVENAEQDPRFSDNELVKGDLHVRYYAGVPLLSKEGYALGTLCVIDYKPRQLSADQLEALQVLTRQVMSQFELRRALADLRLSENRFASVARAVSDVIWDWDMVRQTVWWSEGFFTVFGHDRETTDRLEMWDQYLHPQDRSRVKEGFLRAVKSGETTWTAEYRFRRRNGTYAPVHDRGQIMRHANGTAYRMVGGMTDLTERKQLEAQYLRSQRMESIGALAGGMAHDLNNMLTPILLSISLLKDAVAHDPESTERLDTIETSARRGADLIRQVLSFARGLDGVHSPTSVVDVLNEAVHLARGTFSAAIRVALEHPSDLWWVRGDATHLHQIFMNLLLNARDAVQPAGTISVSARNAELSDAECEPYKLKGGLFVIVTVRDTGPGIVPEIMDRIFEPFFTTKKQGAGTGLGLATVHGIVASHHGFVRVTSELGEGATFEVCLPADRSVHAAALSVESANEKTGHGETILLVDDEELIRSMGAQTLRAAGFRVLTAENGADGIAVYREHADEITLALVDMMMPVMDGPAFVEALRRIHPHLPVILASGIPPTEDVAAKLGVKHVLAKPYSTSKLVTTIRQALGMVAS